MNGDLTERETPICIVYSGNAKVFEEIFLSALSLCMHTSHSLHFVILTMDLRERNPDFLPISEQQVALLDTVTRRFCPHSGANRIDATEVFRRELGKSKNLGNHFTPYATLRLFADVYALPNRVIYLDSDTMCRGDIAELFAIDVADYDFGAVLDAMGHIWVAPHYCNSGVLLLNLEHMRRTELLRRARHCVATQKMFMPDQTALNRLGKKKLLPRRFNEQRAVRDDTLIKHFCRYFKWYGPFFRLKTVKQTEIEQVHEVLHLHAFDDVYAEFEKLCRMGIFPKCWLR